MKEIMTCIIVDDEPLAIEKLVRQLKKVSFIEIKDTFSNSISALKYLQSNNVDIAFLDIMMDDIQGITAIELMKKRPIIILTTAFDNYAIKAYELDVCDYLLKPFDFNRLYKACLKAHECHNSKKDNKTTSNSHENDNSSNFMFIKTAYKHQKVCFDEILYIQGMRDYLRIFTINENIMTLQKFSDLENSLPKQKFYRVHRSYLVCIDKIESIENKRIKIKNEIIPISSANYDDFISFLKKQKILNN
ncbi:MAG: DNA-binding response regulator [Marinilabiliales bacterium]|nr:MAG: DNA-binding response regulator [Marinilabiliales bacterium]